MSPRARAAPLVAPAGRLASGRLFARWCVRALDGRRTCARELFDRARVGRGLVAMRLAATLLAAVLAGCQARHEAETAPAAPQTIPPSAGGPALSTAPGATTPTGGARVASETAAAPATAAAPDATASPLPTHAMAPPSPARLQAAIDRAATYIAALPPEALRYDSAIALEAVAARAPSPQVERARRITRALADRDTDHPMRRLFEPAFSVPASAVHHWDPAAGRANPNRPVAEALHCDVHGLRAGTLAYLRGPMRDGGGGYGTTHAAWALALARTARCMPAAEADELAGALIEELSATQPAEAPAAAAALDLWAERLWARLVLGVPAEALAAELAALLERQAADGGFGAPAPGDRPVLRPHATVVAAWTLALALPPTGTAARPAR